MKHLTNPLGVIEQSNINTQPLWKEHSTCGVFQSWRIAVYCRTKVIECRRADSGIPIPSLPRSQWILFSTQHTLALSHNPTIITQQRGHTVSTETKSWSDSSPPRPKSFFSGPRRRPSLSSLSMVLIEFTTFEEHFGSAASRMTSMYSQFVRTACVTAGKSGYSIQFSAS